MDAGISNPSGNLSTCFYVASAFGRTPTENNFRDTSALTGENFSMEVLQARVTSKENPIRTGLDHGYINGLGLNVKQNPHTGYEDQAGSFGLQRVESDFCYDDSSCFPLSVPALEVNARGHADTAGPNLAWSDQRINDKQFNDSFKSSSSNPFHGSQTRTDMRGTSENPRSGKVKFLCSFGGKIMARPGDAKLRYVGGETRIISIKKNLSWKEFMHKTFNICDAPHIIKYQLPGEDLDSLISVSSEEDLQNMMDEYYGVDKAGGSQRLRIFLIPLNDAENCSLDPIDLQCSSEFQYFAAVNNIGDLSLKESSTGNSLSSQVGYQLDRLLSFTKDSLLLHVDTVDDPDNSQPSVSNQSATSHSPPTSPKLVQQRERRHSRKQSFEDHFIADLPFEIHYDVDRGNLMNKDIAKRQIKHSGLQFQKKELAGEFSPLKSTDRDNESAGYSLCEKSFLQEKLSHCGKFIKQQAEPVSWIAGSNDSASSVQEVGVSNISSLVEPVGSHTELKKSVVSQNSFQRNVQEGTPPFQQMLNNHSDILSELKRTALKTEFSACGNYAESCGRNEAMNGSYHPLDGENQNTEPIKGTSIGELQHSFKHDMGGSASKLLDEKGNRLPQPMKYFQKNNNAEPHINSKLQNNDYNFSIVRGATVSSPVVDVMESSLPTSSLFSLSIGLDKTKQCSLGNQFDGSTSKNHSNLYNQSHRSLEAMKSNLINVDDNMTTFSPITTSHRDSSQILIRKRSAESNGDMSLSDEPAHHLPTTIRAYISEDYCGQGVERHLDASPALRVNDASRASVFHNSENGQVSRQQFSLLDQDMVDYYDSRARNTELGNCDYGTVRPKNVVPTTDMNHNVPMEAVVTVEDVTDRVPSDVPLAPAVIPYVIGDKSDVEELDHSSPRVDSADSAPVSECEDARDDEIDTEGSMSDAAIAEIEAGIYGLQIIKNADLEELRELGSGTFGTVFYGKWRGTAVAIKRIKKSCFSGKLSEQDRLTKDFWREAQILSKLHHPNVVAFYGVVPDGGGGSLATVTEFMVNGSLRHVLLQKDRELDLRKKLIIAMDAAFGMEYLHSKNIVHFDLKCDNLLVNLRDSQRPICKVGDFGLSRIKRNTLVSGGVRGTLPWMAPELLNGSSNRVSEKVDVFSFGIAMWEIITGEEPYANMHCGAIIGGIVNNTLRPPIPENCNTEWRKLMGQCWSADPSQRPSFTEIANKLRSMSMAVQPKAQAQASR
ncbi:serine/threonine-protein kinase STE20-like isoform X2 [Phalaenopsis equestris]|uniref:serine/threonine-protein kinase STE20-like isoform X2 n=1 Tax=Phalaenopsis equestris TaxID=78828 RepID=UPI0009E19CF2|nr:serine/threonine-protein kinase STE20-like isoform X2 [Phalaenopsis equestris]